MLYRKLKKNAFKYILQTKALLEQTASSASDYNVSIDSGALCMNFTE